MPLSRRIPAIVVMAVCVQLTGCGTIDAVKKLFRDEDTEGTIVSDETPRVNVVIEGLDDPLADNVRAMLAVAGEACNGPRWRVEREFAGSDDDVHLALRALGHYQPTIRKSFERVDDCWQASYEIEAGPRVVFGEIDVLIEGPASEDERFIALRAALPVTSGDPLDHGRYEGLKTSIESLAAERGYFDGGFTRNELRVDTQSGRADVILRYESGERYNIGKIEIHQTALDDKLIERLTQLRSNTPYDSTKLAAQNRIYSDTGYFSSVDISPRLREARRLAAEADAAEASGEDGDTGDSGEDGDSVIRGVPVDVTLTPSPRHSYTLGPGYSSDVGPRVRAGYEDRRLNAAGHRWSADAVASPREAEISARYSIPLEDPRTDWLSFQAGYQYLDTKSSESHTTRLGVGKTGTRDGWLETQSLIFSHDSFTVGAEDSTTVLLVPGISWQKAIANKRPRPTRGWSALLQLNGAYEGLVSDTSFIQARLRTHAIYGLPWGDRLLGRLQLGATAVTDFDVLPPSFRFFAGGDTSIRGYAFEALGPEDDEGQVVGGRYVTVGSMEYEHFLNDKWSIAAFVDSGNAYDSFDEGVKTGVGGGVRWLTPIGPLRFDIGVPLDDDDTAFRLHVRFGPDL